MKVIHFPTKQALALALSVSSLSNVALSESYQLEEIIVSAQKKAENLQDVPVSVSAMSAGDLEGLKLRHSTEIAAQVPNMQIQTPFGESQPIISIRGIAMQDFNLNQNSPIGFYVDEVYIGPTYMQGMQMFDLERVEVLRGPQGTLYGKNTTGGAVNFYTKKPSFEGNSGYLTAGFGNYNRREAKGAYETTLIDNVLAVRGALTYTKADGYMENKFPGADDLSGIDEWAGRVTFVYRPNESVEALLRYHKGESTPSNYGAIHVATVDGVDFFGYSRELDGLDDEEINSNLAEKKEMTNEGISLTVNWDINEEYTLTSISSYDEGTFYSLEDDDASPNRLLEDTFAAEARQLTQDLRLTSSYSGPFNWIGGVYWGTEDLASLVRFEAYHDAALFPGSGLEPFAGFAEATFDQFRESYAAYFHSTYDFTHNLSLTFGLRYTNDETTVKNYQSVFGGSDSVVQGFITEPLPKDTISDNNVSGKIGLDYQMDNGTLFYASYSTGYRNSTYNGGALYNADDFRPVDAEEVEAYEVGFKSMFFDKRLQLNGAVFQYDYTDQQFLNFVGINSFLENAGASTIRGFELELVARVSAALSLQAGLGVLDAEFDELVLSGVDLSGNELVSAPDTNFNMSINYEVATLDIGTVMAHFDTVYAGDQFFSVQNTDAISQEAYWVHNARLSLESANDKYTVALWVKNLSDEFYYTYGLDLTAFGGYDFFQRGTPRTFGLEATYRF